MELVDKLNLTKNYLESRVEYWPRHAVILGSGLKNITDEFHIYRQFPLRNIPHVPAPTVDYMDASLYIAKIQGIWCWLVGGRVHYYEGYRIDEVVYTPRFLSFCGVEHFLLTNASGSVNSLFGAGSMVLIKDHINWSLPSPLIGKNENELGPRFPEMIHAYDTPSNNSILRFCNHSRIKIFEGIYLGLSGPQLETPAEYRLFQNLGVDIIGMSTIPEVIAINHMGKKCCAISVVSNNASDYENIPSTSMEEFMAAISSRTEDLKKIIEYWVTINND